MNETMIRAGARHRLDDLVNRETAAGSASSSAQFSDPRSILKRVLLAAPEPAVVYPSERYYYFRMPLGGRLVSGNIRFADVEDGTLSMGYFDVHHQQEMVTRTLRDGEDGVRIVFTPPDRVAVGLDGIERGFVLDMECFEAPYPDLMEGEVLISGIRDESGYFLHLVYWSPGRSMYYLLNRSQMVPEAWVQGESSRAETWFGVESGFCFLRHPGSNRFILVGVRRRDIEWNTMYDGPFDQVPPRLRLRSILEEAYPYVKDAGGIDEHGNFLRMRGQRVAISPYKDYVSATALARDLDSLAVDSPTPLAWVSATYESKKDWRAPVEPAVGATHQRELSRKWPANHWRMGSRNWGDEHRFETSSTWPPNHETTSSAEDARRER